MSITQERKSELIKEFGKNEKDSGSASVQVGDELVSFYFLMIFPLTVSDHISHVYFIIGADQEVLGYSCSNCEKMQNDTLKRA